MNSYTDIVLLGEQLSEGETIRVLCPNCRGGDSAEQSLSITVSDGTLLWQCFRAKCGAKGGKGGTFISQAVTVKKKKNWEGKTHELPSQVTARIKELWGLEDCPNWWWTTDYGGRVAMSVRCPKDLHRGWALRDITGEARTKVLTYIDTGEGLSWYKTSPHYGTILVEDMPSAVRASRYINSVALLGTGIGTARAYEIARYATRPIIVALDNDAIDLSFKWAHKYALLWDDVEVLPLKKDLKNMGEHELEELLR